jgi:ADP-heptose:LPS heptosyltransferase
LGKKILILRFSALGDVAMTIPVIWSFRQQYPQKEVYVVSRPFAKDLLAPLTGVHFLPFDTEKHKGLKGFFRLFQGLKNKGPWDAIIDLHGVLRTHVLTSLFKFSDTFVSKFDKGRSEKKALCRKHNKVFRELRHTAYRYSDTFERAGFSFDLKKFPGKALYSSGEYDNPSVLDLLCQVKKEGRQLIGVAPFAKHQRKTWPEDKMLELLKLLDEMNFHIILFGGGAEEKQNLEQFAANLKNAATFAGRLTMAEELKLMTELEVMVSMDSANMHLASLAETRVVSIWGATHPYAGFYGYGQAKEDAVQIDNLACRPCSVFGNKVCYRGDFACMMEISPEMVFKRILSPQKINRTK